MSPKTTPMHASAAGAQARVGATWVTATIFEVALMKNGPQLLIEPYRKHA